MENNNIQNKIKLLQKMALVMQQIGDVKKTGINKEQNYEYRTDEDISAKLNELFVANKIFFYQEVTGMQREQSNLTKSGGNLYLTEIQTVFHYVDIDTGYELVGQMRGAGEDRGDKGLYKAITGAKKYTHTVNFMLSDGSDPEKDVNYEVGKNGQSSTLPQGASKSEIQKGYAKTFKNSQNACDHMTVTTKVSKSEKNNGRTYEMCIDCGAFLKWLDNNEYDLTRDFINNS